MEWPQELLDLFEDPLLEGVRPKPRALTADDRRVAKLQEIAEFYEVNKRLPQYTPQTPLKEKLLWKSLEALREVADQLEAYDTLNLLKM